ncbi:MAG: ABC transporter ATP-binding protein [Armatimonadota bacterium]|nr:ABC transporter ATP-binding protein [Armatimonadota bacterium]MDR7451464.1 ABC transporter ATP-binding protein [Armatimonadota bacterium]MDR7466386.1 ABC transporter ATP-binding protein [Armatimonadota bacterium]MDR7493108.1 ABC transporter ATP-binding protein [Armatimonadota bacterium]MDR7498135.1 ABC transporter ATP-binding protein [Armatimonadota bacterium]
MLEVRGLAAAYGDLITLWDVSFDVRPGELVALVGANGAGKTTTLRTISGLLRPRRGSVRFNGRSLVGLPPHRITDLGIAQVPEGRQLFPLMTVEENLLLGSYPPRARAKRLENLTRVYRTFPVLGDRRRQEAGTLSGGEQQMLALGRALMSDPLLLMLDEPSLGLAPLVVRDVFAVITQIRAQGVTVLLVEQNVAQALAVADRAYVLENGRITLEGSGRELLAHDGVRRAYLGL